MSRFFTIRKGDSPQERQAKRSFKRGQKAKKLNAAKRREAPTTHRPLRSSADSPLTYAVMVEYFCQVNNMDRWAKQPQRVIPLTEDFGLYQNPERVLKCVLHLLYDAKMYREYPTLRYQGKVCFGALYLLDNMCWEIGRHRRWQLLLDNMPPAEQEKLAKLRSFQTGSYDSSTACMLNESVFINRKDGLSDQTYKRKSAELRQLIEQAITEATGQPYALTQEARAAIYSAIGEQFDNVLEHVPHAESAQLCCFYDRTSQELTIMIFNFGPTFAEKLKSSNLPPEVAGPVKEMVTNYTTRHWFIPTKAGRTLSEEDALTLLALQEGISSRLEFDPTRGFGLLDYIDHCFTFSSHCRISIVSGTTAINIDNKYPIGRRYVFGRERRVLALNPENDLLRKPDPNYVRSLSVRFPGVIIETTIPLAISTLPPCLPSPSTSTSL